MGILRHSKAKPFLRSGVGGIPLGKEGVCTHHPGALGPTSSLRLLEGGGSYPQISECAGITTSCGNAPPRGSDQPIAAQDSLPRSAQPRMLPTRGCPQRDPVPASHSCLHYFNLV